jgi:SAM-dependent methyltransferase
MTRLVVLRAGRPEAAHAPEFRYLASWVELQARRSFAAVTVLDDPAVDPLSAVGAGDLALLLAGDRILLGARTLAALGAALDAGADAAVPHRLADLAAPTAPPIYTLRGFEAAEARLLAGPPPPPAGSPPRVALLRRDGLAAAIAGRPSGEPWPDLGSAVAGASRVAHAGLYHEFIDYYGEVRADVLPHVPAGTRTVLEVGCGRGATGELLRRELGVRVTGVELNPVVAGEAERRLDRVVAGDVEDPAVARELAAGGPYDLVLALELFEHLAAPERFLSLARELLRPGGTVLLSTPNVGHYAVVEDLLAGRWDYLPIGILCYTHLRFFTRRTLEDWLGRLGFERFQLIPQRTEESPRIAALAGAVEVDRESLRTKGFWVVIRP